MVMVACRGFYEILRHFDILDALWYGFRAIVPPVSRNWPSQGVCVSVWSIWVERAEFGGAGDDFCFFVGDALEAEGFDGAGFGVSGGGFSEEALVFGWDVGSYLRRVFLHFVFFCSMWDIPAVCRRAARVWI